MNSKNIITKNYILSKLIEKSHPSSNGLYPHEILVLLYAPRFFLWDNYFQCFWEEYYVTDVQSILDSLMKRSFIEIGDLASILETRTCKELKEELKSQKIKSTGKKNELIDRLLSYGDIQKLDKKFSRKNYKLTKKGIDELSENTYVKYYHQKNNSGEIIHFYDNSKVVEMDEKSLDNLEQKLQKNIQLSNKERDYLNQIINENFENISIWKLNLMAYENQDWLEALESFYREKIKEKDILYYRVFGEFLLSRGKVDECVNYFLVTCLFGIDKLLDIKINKMDEIVIDDLVLLMIDYYHINVLENKKNNIKLKYIKKNKEKIENLMNNKASVDDDRNLLKETVQRYGIKTNIIQEKTKYIISKYNFSLKIFSKEELQNILLAKLKKEKSKVADICEKVLQRLLKKSFIFDI